MLLAQSSTTICASVQMIQAAAWRCVTRRRPYLLHAHTHAAACRNAHPRPHKSPRHLARSSALYHHRISRLSRSHANFRRHRFTFAAQAHTRFRSPAFLKRGPPLIPFHSFISFPLLFEQSCRLPGLTALQRCRLPPRTHPSQPSCLPLSSGSLTSPTPTQTPMPARLLPPRRTSCANPSVLTQRTSVRRRQRTMLAAK